MRQIEAQMNAAIKSQKDWKNANTQVINIQGVSFVYLHNNLIAMVDDTSLQIFDGGYQSNTTKSRLNAILSAHGAGGERVFQKSYEWFFQDAAGSVIPFEDGMILN